MSNTNLSGIQLEAALAELIYHRNANDDPITLDSLDAQALTFRDVPSGLQLAGSSYYSTRGFVGQVVTKENTVYVVFRGTDAGNFYDGFNKAESSDLDQTAIDSAGKSDLGDFANDILLGQGTGQQTQLDDALALTRAAQAAAAGKQVIVVGQSLGGGLAGLVSAILNVQGVGIDPAPFQNQLSVVADQLAFSASNFNVPLVPDGASSDFFANSDVVQRQILEANGYSDSDINQYFSQAQANFGVLFTNLQNNLTTYSVTGEILSSAAGLLGTFLGGATPFSVSPNSINVGVSPSISEDIATAVSLHSPTLFNLLVRTEGTGEQFEDLLKSDEELRYSLLENQNISGPIEGSRTDPNGSGFGQSGVGSSGASTGKLYRALWASVGTTNGLYDRFYARFGSWLTSGAVAQGLSATATDDELSVHSGVVKLGLEVVRDSLGEDGSVSDVGMNVFGAGDANGPSAGYVRVNLGDIHPSDPAQLEQLPTNTAVSTIPQIFGVRDINLAIEQQAELALGPNQTQADLLYLNQLLGATKSQITTGKAQFSQQWQLLIVQAGANPNGGVTDFTYDATQSNNGDDASTSTVVIGGSGQNTITGSSANDFLVGGDGNNTFKSGGGQDVIIGGKADNTYEAQTGPTSANSVTFLGGGGANTADYSQVSGALNLTLTVNQNDSHIDQLVNTGSSAMDSFLNVQKIKLSNQADTLKVDAGAMDALNSIQESILVTSRAEDKTYSI